MIDGKQFEVVAVFFGENRQRRDRLLAVRAVVVHQGDFLALQRLHAAFLLPDVFDERGCLAPVRGGEIENPLEDAPVSRRGAPVAHRVDGQLVHRRLGDELVSDAGAVGIDQRGARCASVFQPFVALDAQLGVVLRLALFPGDLDAVDAAVARVEQLDVIDIAVGHRDAVRRIRPRAVHEKRDELPILAPHRSHHEQRRQHRRPGQYAGRFDTFHDKPPSKVGKGLIYRQNAPLSSRIKRRLL